MIITIVGKRGKGKTTLAKSLIQSEKADQVFILDFLGEYHQAERKNIFISFDTERLHSFCKTVWDSAEDGKKTLVIFDEIHIYGKKSPPIEFLYRFGRHKGIEIIAISHRFADLPMIVRSQTEEYYVFQVTEKCDLEFLRYSLPKETVEKISNLEDFQYMVLSL